MLGENIIMLMSKLFLYFFHISPSVFVSFFFRVRVAADNTGNGEGDLGPYISVDATTSEYYNVIMCISCDLLSIYFTTIHMYVPYNYYDLIKCLYHVIISFIM